MPFYKKHHLKAVQQTQDFFAQAKRWQSIAISLTLQNVVIARH
ncbi:hypothetical protein PORCRE_2122 [Porphyromonas crevioricanis JCM 15906]|uniref:Uncharacterized protein n=1 Tax=Porphyromonas crevioricanis JCM 15906 TaxID=1305617 RepID=T1DUA4_9PORP|nr:hypothetical protein PORCRE_2122 [Porphyromonas crevioricanis JCM 15906]